MNTSMLYEYQKEVFNKATLELKENKSSVLGMCPSSGKTFTALKIAEHHIINNENSKVLILAHGQNVLKKQPSKIAYKQIKERVNDSVRCNYRNEPLLLCAGKE